MTPRRPTGGHRKKMCGTCRRRSVKCDKQEPFCGPCNRLGLTCQGYTSSLVIVPFQPARTNPPPTESEMGEIDTDRSITRRAIPVPVPTLALDPISVAQQYLLLRLFGNSARSEGPRISNLLCTFLDRTLPVESLQHKCTKALTVSYFSKTALDPRESPTEEVMKTYKHALRAVGKAIQESETTESDILMSIMCLCLYENIVVTEPRSWIEHYKGISYLIQKNGPDHYQNGRNRDILLACRYTIIMSSGTLHQPCFLAAKRWRKVIELTEVESDNIFDTLINIAVDIPGLLYGLDCLKEDKLLEIRDYSILRSTLVQTLTALQRWQNTSFFQPNASNRSAPQTASAMAFHHMILLLLEELCYLLKVPWPSPLAPLPKAWTDLDKQSTAHMRPLYRHALASEILRLAQQTIGKNTGVYGIYGFLMPLHVAYDHLHSPSPEIDAIENLMGTVIAGQHGFGMGRRYEKMYTSFSGSSLST